MAFDPVLDLLDRITRDGRTNSRLADQERKVEALARRSGPKLIRGIIDVNGGVVAGQGFTVSHPATGQYVITFNPAFQQAPTVIPTPHAEGYRASSDARPTGGGVTIRTKDAAGAAVNVDFGFIAAGGGP